MRTFACLFILSALAGCSDSSEPRQETFEISGTLTDADGAPVAGAAVVLDHEFAETLPAAADKPRTVIGFTIPEPDTVRLTVTEFCGDEILFDSGEFFSLAETIYLSWDATNLEGKQMPEGVYRARLERWNGEPVTSELALARNVNGEDGDFGGEAAHIRENWRLDAVTGEDGTFTLDRACWAFGKSFEHRDEEGTVVGSLTITDRVRLWFYPEGEDYGIAGPWAEIDPESGGVLDFRLSDPGKPRD